MEPISGPDRSPQPEPNRTRPRRLDAVRQKRNPLTREYAVWMVPPNRTSVVALPNLGGRGGAVFRAAPCRRTNCRDPGPRSGNPKGRCQNRRPCRTPSSRGTCNRESRVSVGRRSHQQRRSDRTEIRNPHPPTPPRLKELLDRVETSDRRRRTAARLACSPPARSGKGLAACALCPPRATVRADCRQVKRSFAYANRLRGGARFEAVVPLEQGVPNRVGSGAWSGRTTDRPGASVAESIGKTNCLWGSWPRGRHVSDGAPQGSGASTSRCRAGRRAG